jgi:hypothetical protein
MSERAAGDQPADTLMTTAIAAAARAARDRWVLHRTLKEIERRSASGDEVEADARRYRMARLAMSFHGSPGQLPHLPAIVDRILATREALTVEFMVGPEVTGPAVTQ